MDAVQRSGVLASDRLCQCCESFACASHYSRPRVCRAGGDRGDPWSPARPAANRKPDTCRRWWSRWSLVGEVEFAFDRTRRRPPSAAGCRDSAGRHCLWLHIGTFRCDCRSVWAAALALDFPARSLRHTARQRWGKPCSLKTIWQPGFARRRSDRFIDCVAHRRSASSQELLSSAQRRSGISNIQSADFPARVTASTVRH